MKRKFPTKKYQTQKKSMVLPYGKNIRYKKPTRRTKKAVQQINAAVYQNGNAWTSRDVSVALNTPFTQISAVTQGTAVDQCTGTTVYAKSLYVQAQVMCHPETFGDATANTFPEKQLCGPSYSGGTRLTFPEVAKAKNVRLVVLLDRAPNGTVPQINDVYKTNIRDVLNSAPPNVKNYSDAALAASATSLLMLDPDKSRRFKILMNQVVTCNLNDPMIHIEKYIPLNFYITYSGNTGAPNDATPAMLITNGIYILAFTEAEGTVNADQNKCVPRWAYTAKLRFEP